MNTPNIKCQRCQQSDRVVVAPGSGPHYAKLHCQRCDRWVKWLSQRQFEQLKGQVQTLEQGSLLGGESW